MSYTRPPGDAADFHFSGATYTRPAGDAADFHFGSGAPTGYVDATLGPLVVDAHAAHGVAGVVDVALGPLVVEAYAEHVPLGAEGWIEATLGPLVGEAFAGHGVGGSASVVLPPLQVEARAGHGVGGSVDVALGPLVVEALALHPRYELRGRVQIGGVLVGRLVRAYRLDDGALVGQQDTVAGRFRLHAGFAPAEHYVIALDMSEGATDWVPPAKGHIMSVLAQDA